MAFESAIAGFVESAGAINRVFTQFSCGSMCLRLKWIGDTSACLNAERA